MKYLRFKSDQWATLAFPGSSRSLYLTRSIKKLIQEFDMVLESNKKKVLIPSYVESNSI